MRHLVTLLVAAVLMVGAAAFTAEAATTVRYTVVAPLWCQATVRHHDGEAWERCGRHFHHFRHFRHGWRARYMACARHD
jgi:hypothetical protein